MRWPLLLILACLSLIHADGLENGADRGPSAIAESKSLVTSPRLPNASLSLLAQVPDGGLSHLIASIIWTVKEEQGQEPMKSEADVPQSPSIRASPNLSPKAKKDLGKAVEEMRAGKLAEAHRHLDQVHRRAPEHPEVNYAFGLYSIQIGDFVEARHYLEKALNLDEKHAGALRSLGFVLLRENNPDQALPYIKRAIEAEPTSWRTHALLAEAFLRLGSFEESVFQSERALELGHEQAAAVQPILARALSLRGDMKRATEILKKYLQDHSSDTAASKQLEDLEAGSRSELTAETRVANVVQAPTPSRLAASFVFPPAGWLPPDIDERVPPVESDANCVLDEVMKNTEERVREFVENVDRFTATETITHETINRWGLASAPESLKFDYLVSIREFRPGLLDVQEYRSHDYSVEQFPDGIVDFGLPELLLIFHPYDAEGFEMTCEGLTHWNGERVWQVHFRQRSDRPNTTRSYRVGQNGPSYPAALKGRAWIAASDYQILRIEMDLVAPLPQIRLVADHTVVEYGPVNFRKNMVEMWLPQTAENFYDWRGHRGHRVHRFANYLLFSVDEKQRISSPKLDNKSPAIQ